MIQEFFLIECIDFYIRDLDFSEKYRVWKRLYSNENIVLNLYLKTVVVWK